MAQLGDFARAKELLRGAARAFSPRERVARARCLVAEAEIALASRDLSFPAKTLDSARAILEDHGDRLNAAYARYLEIRRLLLIGRLDEAQQIIAALDPSFFPPALRTIHELVLAGIAMRRLRAREARVALVNADYAASEARIPALTAEVENAGRVLNTPAARLIAHGTERMLLLEDIPVVECVGDRWMPQCRAPGECSDFAGEASGVVCAGACVKRSLAGRRLQGPASGSRIRSEV
jgi:hypothetical protein